MLSDILDFDILTTAATTFRFHSYVPNGPTGPNGEGFQIEYSTIQM